MKVQFLALGMVVLLSGCVPAVPMPPNDVPPDDNGPTACTQEAKLCPDGSSVGRQGPDCEFAACPEVEGWETFEGDDLSFQYPENLDGEYIVEQVWPPEVTLSEGIFSCVGDTAEVNGRTYCVNSQTEGAAGTRYVSYDYLSNVNDSMLNIKFTLGFPQCANYDEPQKSDCQRAEGNFNVDELVDQIAQTVMQR